MAGDVDVGLDDAAMLLEPEPHIPVNPDVSTIPEDVDSPDVAEIAVDVDIPDDVDGLPGVAAVAASFRLPLPFRRRRRSRAIRTFPLAKSPTVEHAPAPLLVLGTVIVPVTAVGHRS